MERMLVELARQGDREAFAEIAAAISPRLFGIARRMLRDFHRAEDATQQAIILIWRDLPKLVDPDRFEAWAFRVVMNSCYAEGRHRRQAPDGIRLLATDAITGDSQADVADRDMLQRAFDRLPVEQRAVLVLQYYLELGHAEIAEVLHVPVGTVKSRASQARSGIRALLEADARLDVAGRTA